MPWLVTTGVPILAVPLCVFGLAWLCVAIGSVLLRWLGVDGTALRLERGLVALAVGAGVLELVPFGLGAVHWLSVRSLVIVTAALAVLAGRELGIVARAAWGSIRSAARPGPTVTVFVSLCLPGLLAAALLALTPTIDADGLGYHLTVPKRWLALGGLDYLPTYPNSNMPMGVEMLYTLALAFAGDAAAKLLHFCLGVAAAVAVYESGKRVAGPVLGGLAVTLFLFGPFGVASLLGWAYLEGATSFVISAATLAWLIWFRSRSEGWLRCAALLAGIAVSFKITAGLLPLALGAATFLCLREDRRKAPKTPPEATTGPTLLLALATLPIVPWLGRAWLVTGNPFFPMFAEFIPSRDFPPEIARHWERFNRYLNWAIKAGAHWNVARRELIVCLVAAAMILAALVALRRLRTPLEKGFAVVVLGTMLAQLGAVGLYTRYWIPMMAVLQLPLLMMFRGALGGRVAAGAVLGLTAALSVRQLKATFDSVAGDVGGVLRTSMGFESQRTFLLRHLPLYPLYETINRDLPKGIGVLLASYCGGFYIDRRTLCGDIAQGSLRLTGWKDFSTDILRLQVTHVLAPRERATPNARSAGQEAPGVLVDPREGRIAHVVGGAPDPRFERCAGKAEGFSRTENWPHALEHQCWRER